MPLLKCTLLAFGLSLACNSGRVERTGPGAAQRGGVGDNFALFVALFLLSAVSRSLASIKSFVLALAEWAGGMVHSGDGATLRA